MDGEKHGGQKPMQFQVEDLVDGHSSIISYIYFILSATSYIILIEKKKGNNCIIQVMSVTWFIRLLI